MLESDVHVLDINDHSKKLLHFLQQSKANASKFITGASVPFTEVEANEDDILQELLKPQENIDPLVQQMPSSNFWSY